MQVAIVPWDSLIEGDGSLVKIRDETPLLKVDIPEVEDIDQFGKALSTLDDPIIGTELRKMMGLPEQKTDAALYKMVTDMQEQLRKLQESIEELASQPAPRPSPQAPRLISKRTDSAEIEKSVATVDRPELYRAICGYEGATYDQAVTRMTELIAQKGVHGLTREENALRDQLLDVMAQKGGPRTPLAYGPPPPADSSA